MINTFCEWADMVFVYFSGHGYRKGEIDYVILNGNEFISVGELYAFSFRQILFLDTCRSLSEERWFEIGDLGYIFSQQERFIARKTYNHLVNASPYGKTTIFSTSPFMKSFETPAGSKYTQAFLDAAIEWYNGYSHFYLTINNAFHASLDHLEKVENRQIPKIYLYPDGEVRNLPIAINPIYMRDEVLYKPEVKVHSYNSYSYSPLG